MTRPGFSLKFIHKILLATSALVIASFVAFTAYIYNDQETRTTSALTGQLKSVGSTTATSIANWLNGRVLMIEALGQTLANDASQPVVDRTVAQAVFKSNFMFTYLGTAADGHFTMSPPDTLPEGYDPRTRPWYKDAVAAKASTLTEPYEDASTKKLIITVATPVARDGTEIGVVGGDLDISAVVEMVEKLDLNGLGKAFLVSEDGTVIMHPDKAAVDKEKAEKAAADNTATDQEPAKTVLADIYPGADLKVGTAFTEATIGGKDQIITFLPIEGLPTVHWYLGLAIDKDKAYAGLTAFRNTAVIATIGAVLVVLILLGLAIRALVSKPLVGMTEAMKQLAAGDMAVEIPGAARRDEIGAMSAAVSVFKENAVKVKALAAEQEEMKARSAAERKAETLRLAEDFERAVGGIVKGVADAAGALKTSAQTMSATAAEANQQTAMVASASNETTSSVQTVSAAAEELSASINEIARQIKESNDVAARAVREAETTNQQVAALATAAQKIGDVVRLIEEIASQTNLLALNATIEAARAGEAGKGFAVVASEVKTLATQTSRATEEITSQISAVQAATQSSVQAIDRIGETIRSISSISGSIAAAVEEQTAATREIARNVEHAAQGTSHVTENIHAVSEAASKTGSAAAGLLGSAEDLARQSDQLKNELARFVAAVRVA
ncbi:methyl-accepting chemotaxis protein [Dongia sp.]|uniref:methyl-accepting chemotaxis protein n=1 Tax=Dongia sp. TaxID=1977262 RepID=UPI003753940E